MNRLLLFLFLTISLQAKTISVLYDVTFGLFGEVGKARGGYKNDGKTYSIEMNATSSGFARFISNNRKESHRSYGVVVDGVLKPHTYIQEITTNSFHTINTFSIDHKQKRVTKNIIKKSWNLNKEILEDKNETRDEKYFADNDLLTLFFNLKSELDRMNIQKTKRGTLYAVGANKDNGAVDIVLPIEQELVSSKELLDTDSDNIVKAILNKKIFGSKRGELFILLDSDYLAKRAVLKDVVFFGDVRGEMIEKEEID